jgi:hypothetical protein
VTAIENTKRKRDEQQTTRREKQKKRLMVRLEREWRERDERELRESWRETALRTPNFDTLSWSSHGAVVCTM